MVSEKPWIQKYIPKAAKEVFGQDKALSLLQDYIVNYKKQKQKCCILYGGIGSGKTSAVHAIANDLGLELIEMNASDFRNQDGINSFVGTAIGQQSLFFKGKIILLDEIDGLSGTKDRGAVKTILNLIIKSTFPVICTVNDPYIDKLSSLRKKAQMIEFVTLDYRTITNNLKRILDDQKCDYDEDALKTLARRAGNDMRAAINDLQTLTNSGKRKLDIEAVKELDENERNRTEKIMSALLKVFKTTDIEVARKAFDNVDEDIDKIALWLEENIPKEYEGADLTRAMDWMSKADVYKGRIRRWQHWRFIVYIFAFYSAGIALSKDEKYKKFVKYGPSSRILKLWQAKMKYMKRKAIAEKIAKKNHSSVRRVTQDVLPFVKVMCKKKDFADRLMDEYELEKEEVDWLRR